jgi:hypothetical protein
MTISKFAKHNNPHSGDFIAGKNRAARRFDHIVGQSVEQVMQVAQATPLSDTARRAKQSPTLIAKHTV